MNAFFDMHVHSKFSIDGVSTMEDYCLIAEKSGIRAIYPLLLMQLYLNLSLHLNTIQSEHHHD